MKTPLFCLFLGRRSPVSGHARHLADGFTLVEIMIVVAIIGVLSGIAVPAWAKSRNSARVKTCIANLRQLESAKVQWAFEFRKGSNDIPAVSDAAAYLRGNALPACPGDGTYRLRRVSRTPTCTLYISGHTLNNLNLDDDADPD